MTPKKALFRGCLGSHSGAPEWQTCMGGDARASRDSNAHAYMPWYLPNCGRKCDAVHKKRKNGSKMKTALENSIFWKIGQSDAESFFLRSELSNDMRYVYFGQSRTN